MSQPDSQRKTGGDTDEIYQQATQIIRARSGDALQLAFQFTPDSIEITYLDDHLLDEDLLPRLKHLQQRALKLAKTTATTSIDAYGDLETIVAAHENTIVLFLFTSKRDGLVAVHDRIDDLFDGTIL